MNIKFKCKCGQRLKASKNKAGKSGECPACGCEFVIPEYMQKKALWMSGMFGTVVAVILAGIAFARFTRPAQNNELHQAASQGSESTIEKLQKPFSQVEGETSVNGPQNTPPAKGVVIDSAQRLVIVDGKPFFPIGCMGIPETYFEQAKEAGFNCTVRWGAPSWWCWISWLKNKNGEERRAAIRQYLDKADSAGLRVIEWPITLDCGKKAMDLCWGNPELFPNYRIFVKEKLPALIDAVKDHPALLAYYGPDEPDLAGNSQEWHDIMTSIYQTIKNRDQAHPVFCMFAGTIKPEWSDSFDIAGIDCYGWSNKPLGLRFCANPLITYKRARENANKARVLQVPYWHVPLVHFREGNRSDRVRPEEQRLQAYLAVIGGAQGLIWWQWPPDTSVLWESFHVLLREMQTLSPVLLEPDIPAEPKYNSEHLGLVLPLLLKNHDGHAYILAANAARFPIQVNIAVPSIFAAQNEKVEVMFDNQIISVREAAFREVIEPFTVRVYRLARPWPNTAPLNVTLEAMPQKNTEPTAELAQLLSIHSDNIVPDPEFTNPKMWDRLKRTPSDDEAQHEIIADKKTGSTMLHVTTCQQPGLVAAYGSLRPIQLQPLSRYLLAVRGKVWSAKSTTAYVQLRPLDNIQETSGWTQWRQLSLPNHGSEPETVGLTFTTGKNPFKVVAEIIVRSGGTEAWFDHIELKTLPNSKNQLHNSSFEEEGVPGEPLDWYGSPWAPAGLLGNPDADWCIDSKEAYDGTKSLRLRKLNRDTEHELLFGKELLAAQELKFDCPPRQNDELTLSFYAKADNSRMAIGLLFPDYGYNNGNINLSTDWQRYRVTHQIKKHLSSTKVQFSLTRGTGTVWIDAVQLEHGPEATKYENGGR